MQKIAVIGRRFSGSTVLCRILDHIPGVSAVGETHWLLKGHQSCTTCGESCKFINASTLGEVKAAALYDQLCRVLSTETLVTSDKHLDYLEQVTRPNELTVVVAFKSPYAFYASDKRGHPRHIHVETNKLLFPKLTVAQSMALMKQYYTSVLEWQHPRRKIFVSLERFCSDYPTNFRVLGGMLGFEGLPLFVDFYKKHHFVLGNFDAMDSKRIAVDMRWARELTKQEKRKVGNHKPAQKLYRRLLSLSVV